MAYRVARVGGRIVEVPICFTDRVLGTSKMSWRIIGEAAARVTLVGHPRSGASERPAWPGRVERDRTPLRMTRLAP